MAKPTHKLEVHREPSGFYWRIVAKNGQTVCDGAESYERRGKLARSVRRLLDAITNGTVDVAALLPEREPAKGKPVKT